jgi:pyridoxal phosphate enzyme (YggS family)
MTDELTELRRARERVLGRIADACARAGRSPSEVTLVAVSKTVAAERVRAAVDAGFTVLGENRVQELVAKAAEVTDATWHLIGPLQSNKARRAVEVASVIESLDTIELARRLDRLVREVRGLALEGPAAADARLPVFLQVNVDDDPAKSGFSAEALPEALGALTELAALEVRGLMTVGRLVASAPDARPTFVGLRELSASLRAGVDGGILGAALSMGMSDDFEIAVEEGATVVRVGRAIFGARPAA